MTRFPINALLPLFSLVLLLSACGRDEAPAPIARAEAARAAKPDKGDLSAAEVAAQAREGLRCPAAVAAREGQRPVHDVLGVSSGMALELARQTVLCSDERLVATSADKRGFRIKTFGQKLSLGFSAQPAQAKVHRTGREIVQDMQDRATARGLNSARPDLQPGQAKWYVSTVGLAGQERVLTVAREEWFAAERLPTLASVEQALVAKYGLPTVRGTGNGVIHLGWSYDPADRPLKLGCNATANPESPSNLSADCGIAVAAELHSPPDNPGLARMMRVGTVDQARAMALLEATEQSLQQADAQRRAREVEQAGKGAPPPKL